MLLACLLTVLLTTGDKVRLVFPICPPPIAICDLDSFPNHEPIATCLDPWGEEVYRGPVTEQLTDI